MGGHENMSQGLRICLRFLVFRGSCLAVCTNARFCLFSSQQCSQHHSNSAFRTVRDQDACKSALTHILSWSREKNNLPLNRQQKEPYQICVLLCRQSVSRSSGIKYCALCCDSHITFLFVCLFFAFLQTRFTEASVQKRTRKCLIIFIRTTLVWPK